MKTSSVILTAMSLIFAQVSFATAGSSTPCPPPPADASTLFSMITNSNTTAQAVQSFLQTHIVAVDALNNQCETTLEVSVDANRQDLFTVLFNQYKPDLNAPEPQSRDSIYSYVLGHGTVAFLGFLQSEASSQKQSLSLTPVMATGGYDQGTTELMIASTSTPSVSMIQYWISRGNSVNSADSAGITALLDAAGNNSSVSVLQSLIQAGANINATDCYGSTALMYAAELNPNVSVIQTLIKAGASINVIDANGKTALLNAASNVGAVQALIQAGADVNTADLDGDTALIYIAASTSSASVIQALVQAGANVNAADSNGLTALMNAVGLNPNVTVIQALIQAGAKINAADSDGMTVLMYAAFPVNSSNGGTTYEEQKQDQVIQALLHAGANSKAQDQGGETALNIAQRNSAPQSILTLLGG
jgi:ankyrin repeat protein